MPNVNVKVSFDKKAALVKIRAATDDALEITGIQAIKDVERYVPNDQNFLRDSGITNSGLGGKMNYVMRWSEPYAQYLWHGEVMKGNPVNRTYGPEKLRFTDALARMEWAKYAAEVYGEDWEKVFQSALRREIGK